MVRNAAKIAVLKIRNNEKTQCQKVLSIAEIESPLKYYPKKRRGKNTVHQLMAAEILKLMIISKGEKLLSENYSFSRFRSS